MQETMG